MRLIFVNMAENCMRSFFPSPQTSRCEIFLSRPPQHWLNLEWCQYVIFFVHYTCTCFTCNPVCPTQHLSFLGEKKIWTVLSHLRLSGHFERRSRNLTSPPRWTRWRRDKRFGSFANFFPILLLESPCLFIDVTPVTIFIGTKSVHAWPFQ